MGVLIIVSTAQAASPDPVGLILFDPKQVDRKANRLTGTIFWAMAESDKAGRPGRILVGPIPIEVLREAGYATDLAVNQWKADSSQSRLPIALRVEIRDWEGRMVVRSENAVVGDSPGSLKHVAGALATQGMFSDPLWMLLRAVETALDGNLPETNRLRKRFREVLSDMRRSAYRKELVDDIIAVRYQLEDQVDPSVEIEAPHAR